MLVGMLKLWASGKKLTAEELRKRRRALGRLQVCSEPDWRLAKRGDRAALLMPLDGSLVALDELHAIRIHSIDARGMVLVGTEITFRRKAREEHRQAWWCWPVKATPLVVPEPPEKYGVERPLDEIDLEEEREQIAGNQAG
jgi:hypothetical protein